MLVDFIVNLTGPWYPDIWSNFTLDVSVRGFFDENLGDFK